MNAPLIPRRDTSYPRSSQRLFAPSGAAHRCAQFTALLLTATVILGCRREILSDLTEREASKITNELRLRGIDAATTDSGKQRYAISVTKGDAGEASRIAGLIKPLLATRAESAKPPGILSGPDEERLYVSRQLSRQLEDSLQLLPPVLAARVTIAFSPKPPIDEQRTKVADPGSASVLIIASPGASLSSDSLSHFIANGTTIPQERIHVIISELPGAPAAAEAASERIAPPPDSLGDLLRPMSEEVKPTTPAEAETDQSDGSPLATALLIPSLPPTAVIASLLIIGAMSIPIFFRVRARALRLAFRNLA